MQAPANRPHLPAAGERHGAKLPYKETGGDGVHHPYERYGVHLV